MKNTMYSQNQAGTGSDPTAQSDSRMVADILSSMANGEGVTPTTLAVIEGFCTGIPTRTTPTLTPTTLRNIEQTYLEFQNIASQPEEHVHQAGFVPPVVTSIITSASTRPSTKQVVYQTSIGTKDNQQEWYGEPNGPVRTMSVLQSGGSVNSRVGARSASQTKTRGTGGRRPVKDDRISPEEEERRRVRRERNKMAAARCRKRRMDHTNSLVDETDDLEEKKQELQNEIQALQNEKEELEFILEAHRAVCKIKGSSVMLQRRPVAPPTVSPPIIKVKEETPLSDSEEEPMLKCMPVPISRPRTITRPTSLPIASMFSSPSLKMSNPSAAAEATGVPVQTPSTGIFNFDALMEGGTGLTPVSSGLTPLIPTCSGQQRNSNNSIELDSPDSMLPSKLVSL